MSRQDVNRAAEMEVFVHAVEAGGFSAAARALAMTPSAVSKLVARLEARLGTRLLQRSTRALQLTAEGCVFYERSRRVLADIDEAERLAASAAAPRGRVSVNTNVPFGVHVLLPLLPRFLERHPEITLDVVLTDEVVDLLEKRTDVAIRGGPMKDSRLVARKLGHTRWVVAGSPDYLARAGVPRRPEDLARHNRIGFNYARALEGWPFVVDGVPVNVPVDGNIRLSDGDALRRTALAGGGLVRLAWFMLREDVLAGRLRVVLEDFNPGDTEDFHAVFIGAGGHLPTRVRALLDFLADEVTLDQGPTKRELARLTTRRSSAP
ncbi:MAG: LysR family transcriptional regulator [Burkholderiaceae bacterium]